MEVGNEFRMASVLYGYGEAAHVCISARIQAVLKSEHRKRVRSTIGGDVAQHSVLCNGGTKRFEVGSLCNYRQESINVFYAHC